MQLCVVSGIEVPDDTEDKKLVASGGELTVLEDWNPRDPKHKLETIACRCEWAM